MKNKIPGVLLLLFCMVGCEGKQVRDLQKAELENLERLSLNLDTKNDHPILRSGILSVIMFSGFEIETCYQKESRLQPELVGKIKIFFTVARSGKVTDFKIKETTLDNIPIETCVERIFRKMEFQPYDHMIDVTHTIKFSKAEN